MKTLEVRMGSIETKIDDLTDSVASLTVFTQDLTTGFTEARKEIREAFVKTHEEIEDLARMAANQFCQTATKEDLEHLQTEILEAIGSAEGRTRIRSIV